MASNNSSWNDFVKWRSINYSESSNPTIRQAYEHHPLISAALLIGNAIISVIDIPTMKYIYTSPNYSEWTGWNEDDYLTNGVKYAFSRVHPDDQPGLISFSGLIHSYFKNLHESQRNNYRSFWDYRVQNNHGEYIKVIQQDCALRHQNGVIEELLVFAFKIDSVSQSDCQHLRLTDGKENRLYKFTHDTKKVNLLQPLTLRELQIAGLIAQSKSLKEIAALLNISFNTVKVHSGNILDKLQVNDSLEMVNLLRIWGFI